MTTKTLTYWCITLLMMLLPKSLHAQLWDSPLRLAVKTNMVYDLPFHLTLAWKLERTQGDTPCVVFFDTIKISQDYAI